MVRVLVGVLVLGVVLTGAARASAATCTYNATGNWTTGGSCGATPAATDTVVIGAGVNVTVDADHAIAGITMHGGTISFSGSNPTLTDTGSLSSTVNDTLTGNGTLSVGGTFDHSAGTMLVGDAADLVLGSTAGISGGAICVLDSAGGDASDDPSLQIDGTFTIGSGADPVPFPCNGGIDTAALRVGATGTLVDAHTATTSIGTPMQVAQGGLVHVTAGTLSINGGSSTATDQGEWSVDSGTTLQFTGSSQLNAFGSHTSIHGDGTVQVSNLETIPAGATFTISNLTITSRLTLDDNATAFMPNTITLDNGVLSGNRDVTPTVSFTQTGGVGAVDGGFTTTIGPSTALTISGELGIFDAAHFVLNTDFTLGSGADICLIGDGPGTADDPALDINAIFTIDPTASADPFSCNSGVNSPGIKVNATGTFVDARPGVTSLAPPMSTAGTVHIAGGQTLNTAEYDQIDGATTIDAGGAITGDSFQKVVAGGTMTVNGTLGGTVVATGGVLNGNGTLTGDLDNTSGTVAPGSSPGILTVAGDFTQGPGGTLGVDIDGTDPGTDYDRLAVGGEATLAGTLAIAGSAFTPADTDVFDVLTADSTVTGTFGTVTGVTAGGGKIYEVGYEAGAPGHVRVGVVPGSGGDGAGGGGGGGGGGTPTGATPSGGDGGTLPSPAPGTGPAPQVVASAAAQLLACSKRPLVLEDVIPRRTHVDLLGVAERRFVGKSVALVFAATGRVVAHARVRPDGRFAARAPLPAVKIRRSNRARYQARIGHTRSLKLKLFRRMIVTSTQSANGMVTIAGRVIPPLALRRTDRVITLQRLVTCSKAQDIKRIQPRSDGSFRVTVRAPEGQRAAVYRVRTKVGVGRNSKRLQPTFTLPRAIDFG